MRVLRLLKSSELVRLNGQLIKGAFAVDEKAGLVRRYYLDEYGQPILQGNRAMVEIMHGEIAIVSCRDTSEKEVSESINCKEKSRRRPNE